MREENNFRRVNSFVGTRVCVGDSQSHESYF